ncbi:GNAT family N-acetyltransferase [Sporosarcina sp. FA9]|uniref:GNAT family N-acetyltransferase n=1 Tax=Sporosarcina sp. FA9 TaxID=3413030 RepID=UPI003F6594B8
MNFDPYPELKTDRLLLRQLVMNDDERIFEYQSNKENFKFVDMPIYTSLEETQNYVTKMNAGVSSNQWIIWGIADAKTNSVLGTISIWNISTEQLKAELGYGLFPGSFGKGIMSEALVKVVEYGFEVMGLKTIEAYTNAMNDKSIALLERNKFTKISSLIETETSNRVPVEMVVYGCNYNEKPKVY